VTPIYQTIVFVSCSLAYSKKRGMLIAAASGVKARDQYRD